ncbi:MAG: hypothetical protein MUF13_05335 [Akkermansiaceae bacterium]|jgi:hypothetical protein|nr:hypothetical protein [Akkermansiaceae bacterium]
MKKADHLLVQKTLDGDVSREEFDAFQERLRKEPDLADLYEGYAHIHHALSEEFEGGFAELDSGGRGRFHKAGLVLVAAAVVVLTSLALWFRPWEKMAADDVAVLTFSVDAVWQIEGDSRPIGGATGVSKGSHLSLRQGRAGVSLEPSVTAVIEGPAELTFVSETEMALNRGRGFFHRGGSSLALKVTTPRMTALDSGTEFGMEVLPEGPDQIHVTQGSVSVTSTGTSAAANLTEGDALQVDAAGKLEVIPANGASFPRGLGRFQTVFNVPFDAKDWRIDFGSPSIGAQLLEGANFTAYCRLKQAQPADDATVLLATIDVAKTSAGEFHTDGWAGMSFFSGGKEMLFFGDSFGTRPTWSLDVKQRVPVILPESPVIGPREVTLRYDARSGAVSLHEGSVPLKAPFCEGKLPAGLRFDEIRLGASSGAALSVQSLQIRTGG